MLLRVLPLRPVAGVSDEVVARARDEAREVLAHLRALALVAVGPEHERRPLHSELSGDAKVGNRRRHGVEPDRIHATRMRTFGERASTAAHP